MNFLEALQKEGILTENGMPTNTTSFSDVLDLFYRMGASRRNTDKEILGWFTKALNENFNSAILCMFLNRDIRGGQGERRSFRIMFRYLANYYPDVAVRLLKFIPVFGRWDDVWHTTVATKIESNAFDFILHAIKAGQALAAKWMPREGKANYSVARAFMEYANLSRRDYRRLLALNTQVVESLMCKHKWDMINYEHVPSKAINKYVKAWYRHDETRFTRYLESVKKGTKKINAGAIFPHDIVGKMLTGGMHMIGNRYYVSVDNLDAKTINALNAQWDSLPNYLSDKNYILPIIDTSGSMRGLPAQVAVSLGIYISQRNRGPFENAFITFSEKPELQILKGNLYERVVQLSKAFWDQNTNLEAVFELILNQAKKHNLPQSEMPRSLLIISDMQFDQCNKNLNDSAIRMIDRMYQEAGYTRPNIVFWNVRNSNGIPTKHDHNGTALVSGFSPSMVKQLLDEDMTPLGVMLKALNQDRYSFILNELYMQ